MKDVNSILDGSIEKVLTKDEQKTLFEALKEIKILDMEATQKENLIKFLTETANKELATDYLFHVLDSEIPYPIEEDDERVKSLFSDERMKSLKDQMMTTLEDDVEEENA